MNIGSKNFMKNITIKQKLRALSFIKNISWFFYIDFLCFVLFFNTYIHFNLYRNGLCCIVITSNKMYI
jgi:hypothetical protein